jgi:hypothetical protein
MTPAWLLAGIAILSLGIFAIAIAESDGRQHFLDIHHEYIGLVALVLVVALRWPMWIGVLAVAVMLEDSFQHSMQVDDPSYLSPLHRCYVAAALWLIHRPWCPAFLARFLAR